MRILSVWECDFGISNAAVNGLRNVKLSTSMSNVGGLK